MTLEDKSVCKASYRRRPFGVLHSAVTLLAASLSDLWEMYAQLEGGLAFIIERSPAVPYNGPCLSIVCFTYQLISVSISMLMLITSSLAQ